MYAQQPADFIAYTGSVGWIILWSCSKSARCNAAHRLTSGWLPIIASHSLCQGCAAPTKEAWPWWRIGDTISHLAEVISSSISEYTTLEVSFMIIPINDIYIEINYTMSMILVLRVSGQFSLKANPRIATLAFLTVMSLAIKRLTTDSAIYLPMSSLMRRPESNSTKV